MAKHIEEKLAKYKCKSEDRIPEGFIGKSGKGYFLRNMVKHKGRGSA